MEDFNSFFLSVESEHDSKENSKDNPKEIFENQFMYTFDYQSKSILEKNEEGNEENGDYFYEAYEKKTKTNEGDIQNIDIESQETRDLTQKLTTINVESTSTSKSQKEPKKKSNNQGRLIKNGPKTSEGRHNKYAKDNIRRKVKVNFSQSARFFFNALIKVNWNGHQKNKFRTIDNELTKDITIKSNSKLHLMTMKDFMSQRVSKKYKCKTSQNEKTVEILSKLKPHLFNPLFDMTVGEFYAKIFCENPQDIIKQYNIDNPKIEIKKKKYPKFLKDYYLQEDDKEYQKSYIEGAQNFFSYFQNTHSRNRNKKQITASIL